MDGETIVTVVGRAQALIDARFWRKVDVRRARECWEWTGRIGTHGYGVFTVHHRMQVLAHRYALTVADGPAPVGHEALHSCDNKRCANPGHLRWGTHAQNMAQAADSGLTYAPNAAKATCPHGHEMTEANTIRKTKRHNGRAYAARACRECNRIYLAKRREGRAA